MAVKSPPEAVREPLEKLGFRKRTGWIFTIELEIDVIGWVGMNSATRHQAAGTVEVNPVVGVRNQAVERVIAELAGLKFHPYIPPTVSSPIGYVMPEHRYTSWILTREPDLEAVGSLVSAVETWGLPFMRGLLGLEALADAAARGLGHGLEYKLPVARFLSGQVDRARDEMTKVITDLGDRNNAATDRLRAYAVAFFAMLDSQASP